MVQNRSHAVMQQRTEAQDSLDDFPTPAWATRAAIEIITKKIPVYGAILSDLDVREPCANRGYMVRPLEETFRKVHASDIADYGSGYPLVDYLFPGPMQPADWTFMNPPFNLGCDFIIKSFDTPRWIGTAAFVRSAFLESKDRYERLFSVRPPTIVAQFVERVILHKGIVRDPDKLYWDADRAEWRRPSTATSYCWLFWAKGCAPQPFHWIEPCRKRLTKVGDYLTDDMSLQPDGGPTCSKMPLSW